MDTGKFLNLCGIDYHGYGMRDDEGDYCGFNPQNYIKYKN